MLSSSNVIHNPGKLLEFEVKELNIKLLRPLSGNFRPTWFVGIVLSATAIYFGIDAYRLAGEARADQLRYEHLRKLSKPAVQVKPSREKLEEQKRWSALYAERSFDWYAVFVGLENSSEADIELLEFAPDKAGRKMVLRGEARTIDTLTDYIERLAAQEMFAQVYLAHEKSTTRGNLSLIEFEIRLAIVVKK